MTSYNTALEIAKEAHAGVFRKDGEPYINHPLRVSQSAFVNDDLILTGQEIENARIVAVLHDVIEDHPEFYERVMLAGFNDQIIEALKLVTKEEGISYKDYVANLIKSGNKIAMAVKLGDLTDNLNSSEKLVEETTDLNVKKKFEQLRTTRWLPAYNNIVNIWLNLPEIEED